jgi:hypothetical protein
VDELFEVHVVIFDCLGEDVGFLGATRAAEMAETHTCCAMFSDKHGVEPMKFSRAMAEEIAREQTASANGMATYVAKEAA